MVRALTLLWLLLDEMEMSSVLGSPCDAPTPPPWRGAELGSLLPGERFSRRLSALFPPSRASHEEPGSGNQATLMPVAWVTAGLGDLGWVDGVSYDLPESEFPARRGDTAVSRSPQTVVGNKAQRMSKSQADSEPPRRCAGRLLSRARPPSPPASAASSPTTLWERLG